MENNYAIIALEDTHAILGMRLYAYGRLPKQKSL